MAPIRPQLHVALSAPEAKGLADAARRDWLARAAHAAGGSGLVLAGLAHSPAAWAGLSESDAASGIRVALERGAIAAIGQLGREGGFFNNPEVRIPLPAGLESAAKLLRSLGQGKRIDELQLAMNRAAELAVPKARTLLVSAAKSVTLDDAVKIVRGGDTSVTDYFAGRTRAPLTAEFLPIVTAATQRVSLAERYNALAAKGAAFGLLRAEDANLQQYVTAKALDGLYLMIGKQERAIRADPIGTGSAILKKVFRL